MNYEFKNGALYINVPIKNQSKFRCKERNHFNEFGKGLAPATNPVVENAYIEWQIGYDSIVGDEKKETKLNNWTFTGANGKTKNLFELSEFLYELCKNNIINLNEIENLLNDVKNYNHFLHDDYQIRMIEKSNINYNSIDLFQTETTLPTFFKKSLTSELYVEVSIEKQQYAVGVQPMLYLNIPINSFENKNKIISHTSSQTPFGILKLDINGKDIIINLIKIFGFCSNKHQHDIIEILEIIKNNAF